MLDKLIEAIIQFIDQLLPCTIIFYYEKGVRLRNGKKYITKRARKIALKQGVDPSFILEPGFYWKVPFLDTILTHMIKTTTIPLSEQSVTTKDWKQVVVKGVIKYDVDNVEQLLLEVNDPIDAIVDMAKGIIRAEIRVRDWKDCNDFKLENAINKKMKEEAAKWGVRVDVVTLTDLGDIRSFRLFNSNHTNSETQS